METYPITIGKITRHVPVVETLPGVHIPLIELMGDVELVQAAAEALVKQLPPETDTIVTMETSPIVLAHAMSAISGKPYIVVRRRRRPYMQDPIIQEVESLTLGVSETLWLDSRMAEKLLGQNVALVFDVVSSGGTMKALEKVVKKAGAKIVARMAAFHQGNSKLPITFVTEIPIMQTA